MPDWNPHIRPRLAALRLSPPREAEIAEELAQHLDDRWRELVSRGATPDEAARLAVTEFDGARLEALLGTLRQAKWHDMPPLGQGRAFSLDSVRLDLRHAIRALRATPSFTLGALLVLALGTGATTAIFSVVDAVALRPLPFSDPDRLVAIGERADVAARGAGGPQGARPGAPAPAPGPIGAMPGAKPPDPDALRAAGPQNYLDWAAQQQVFESIAAVAPTGDYTFQRPGAEPEVITAHRVTASFFDVLRAPPSIGQVFTSQQEVDGSDRVAVLSDAFWRRHFTGDPAAIGRTVTLNDEPYTIVGIMPAGFAYPPGALEPAEVWMPWVPGPNERVRGRGGRSFYLHTIARLRPDVSLAQAQAQMSQVAAAIAAANPATNTGTGIGVRPLRDHFVGGSMRSWMLMLLAAVAIVLIIACANVANLWLARASVKQRDAAVRMALGAGRGRLVQQYLIESLVVSVAGAIAGLAIAWPAVRLLRPALPEGVPRVASIGIDIRVLVMASVVALLTGLISGIVPALQGSRPAPSNVLHENSRGGGVGRGRRRARAALVVAEVAAAVVLLVGAALFIGSFINVMRVDPGFRSDGVLTAQIVPRTPPGSTTRDLGPAVTEIVGRVQRLPGVVHAAWGSPGIPLRINLHIDALIREPGQMVDMSGSVSLKVVTPDYHKALAIPLRAGRYFGEDDRAGAEPALILSEAAARVFFAGEDPVGQTAIVYSEKTPRRVVGVVANARQSSFEVSPHPEVYLPIAQRQDRGRGYLVVHTTGDPNSVLPSLRTIVAETLPGEPLRSIARLDDLISVQTAERRLNMLMFSLFGLLGLVIAAVGLFAVLAYLVAQQTRDIGVRLALGATPSRIVGAVFTYAVGLVAVGLIAGGLAAWWLANLARRFLFGLDPADPRLYALAMATLLAAAIVAAVLPARRAAGISPLEALRND